MEPNPSVLPKSSDSGAEAFEAACPLRDKEEYRLKDVHHILQSASRPTGSPVHLHLPRSLQPPRQDRHAVVHRQGQQRHAVAGAQGILRPCAKEWNLPLIVGQNKAALDAGMHPSQGRVNCCSALKTEGLKALLAEHGFTGVIAGIRRDEEGTRAKERVFSPRNDTNEWDVRDQPPEFWDQFKTDFAPGTHLRIHPLLAWTELDVWRYIAREGIPVVDLYFAKNGQRYRSLGCAPCTGSIASTASTVEEIVEELETTKTS
ncbi:MAG: phosphoadenosine phosphosulfate reductase family protein, partial [Magnetospirillum gryphiswaldense]|nr:phosphoadenosine phosphosulfate reductase family protein [Magnetospirillum gryphiswaldense]